MNAAPLMQRLLSEAPLPDWHRSPQAVKDVQLPLLQLCKDYGINLSEVAIRFAVDHPAIATTIVGMSEVKHVKQNLKALDLQIPADLMAPPISSGFPANFRQGATNATKIIFLVNV